MSTILVDNLTGKTSAGDITVTSEGGAATQSLQQGLVKVWWCIDGTGTVEFRDSFNCASVTDNAAGDYTANYTNNMSSANYGSGSQGRRDPAVSDNGNLVSNMAGAAPTSSSMRQDCARSDFGGSEDLDRCNALVCGDLA